MVRYIKHDAEEFAAAKGKKFTEDAMKKRIWSAVVLAVCVLLGACESAGTAACEQGMRELEQGNYAEAEDAFGKALTADGNLREAYRGRGIRSLKQEKFREAEADFNKVIELTGILPDETAYDSLRWLGETYYLAQEYEKSADVYVRLLKLEKLTGKDAPLVNDLALKLADEEAYEAALELLDAGAQYLDRDSAQTICWNRIVLAERTDRMNDARVWLEEYCKEYPSDTDAVLEKDALGPAQKPDEGTKNGMPDESGEEGRNGAAD